MGRPREETRQRGPLVERSPKVAGKGVTRRVVFRPEAEDEVLETEPQTGSSFTSGDCPTRTRPAEVSFWCKVSLRNVLGKR